MLKKIFIMSLMSLLLMGAVSAADYEDFNIPDGFEDLGDNIYLFFDTNKQDQVLTIVPFNEYYKTDYLVNDSAVGYTVSAYKNATFNYIEKDTNEKGSFEVVEFNGNKYIIDFTEEGIVNETDFSQTYNNLLLFNEKNNVTVVNVTFD